MKPHHDLEDEWWFEAGGLMAETEKETKQASGKVNSAEAACGLMLLLVISLIILGLFIAVTWGR